VAGGPFRVGVLVSGEGTNLQALLDHVHGTDGIEVVCVGSSRAGARGLERAAAAGIEAAVFDKADHPDRDARDAAMGNWLDDHGIDLLVLAGFMEILGGPFIRRFGGRIINVHPSLLPAFAGVGAIQQALDYGVRLIGVTVHFVDEGVDSGPVLLQEAFELPYARDIAAIEAQVHAVEHRLLPRAVRLIAAGAVSPDERNPRLVNIDER
jgi:phosphoribosylglycinamide formyltransferase-1